jgi:TetR/AcrR family transcriptional regulator of autoinduction and epiphytic fitness
VYNHFPSKEALFTRILEQMWERGADGLDISYRSDRPLRAQLLELVAQKMRLLHDASFIDLARIAIAAGVHNPDLARDLIARLGDREEGLTAWVRAAAADGRLKTQDPVFASMQLQGLVKGFAFWPQIAMGQPPLSAAQQKQVGEEAVEMFLAYYAA